MGFMTLRELRGSTARVDELLERDGSVVVTSNGKPAYLMLPVDDQDLEQTLVDLRVARAKRAVHRMQATSARLGNDGLTMDEIEAEIEQARAAR